MQKMKNDKTDSNNDNDGEVTLRNVDKNFKKTCYMCRKKEHTKQNYF